MPSTSHFSGVVGDIVPLPLRKFSFLTTATSQTRSLQWNHISQLDLLAVFDHITVQDIPGILSRKEVLKVVQGGKILEEVSLDELSSQAKYDEDRSRSQPLSKASRILFIIARRPVIAIRYQLPKGQCRRIQMQFTVESGYEATLRSLTSHGLPISDQNEVTSSQERSLPNRSYISNAAIIHGNGQMSSGSSIPSLQQAYTGDERPLSSDISIYANRMPEQHYQERSEDGGVQNPTQTNALGFATSDAQLFPAYTPRAPTPLFRTHPTQDYYQRDCNLSTGFRPYLPVNEPTRHERYSNISSEDTLRRGLFDATPGSGALTVTTLEDSMTDMLPPKRTLPFPDTSSKRAKTNGMDTSNQSETPTRSEIIAKDASAESSAAPKKVDQAKSGKQPGKKVPTEPATVVTTSTVLSASSLSGQDASSVSASSSKGNPASIESATGDPVPPLADPPDPSSSKKKGQLSLIEPSAQSSSVPATKQKQPPKARKSRAKPAPKKLAASAPNPVSTDSSTLNCPTSIATYSKITTDIVQPCTSEATKHTPKSNRKPTRKPTRKTPKSSQAPVPTATPIGSTTVPTSSSPPLIPALALALPDVAEEWKSAVEAFILANRGLPPVPTAATAPPAARPLSDLAEYAAHAAVERRAALNTMIVETMMDPAFEVLVEDVESAWTRIGLGM